MTGAVLPPPPGPNLNTWAQQVTAFLGRTMSRLQFKGSSAAPSENGVMLWDEANGYPVVSKNGVWQPLILEDSPLDFAIKIAEAEVLSSYGDTVSTLAKAKTLLKFGKKEDLGTTKATIWQNSATDETYCTTNAIDRISSSNAADTSVIYLEGHTVTGTGASSQFSFVTQTATLNGQNKVTLTTPLARVSRAYVANGAAVAGDVNVYEDTAISGGVPTTASKTHIVIKGTLGETQSYKAATTFSNSDYAFCTGGWVSIQKKTSCSVDFVMEVRPAGGVFRPVGRMSLDTQAQTTAQIQFNPYAIVPKNADIRIRGAGSTTNIGVDAAFQFYLAAVQ